jgi:hypothetical protein
MCPWILLLLPLLKISAISRIRPDITERVTSVNLPQYLSTALSVMTGLVRDIAKISVSGSVLEHGVPELEDAVNKGGFQCYYWALAPPNNRTSFSLSY